MEERLSYIPFPTGQDIFYIEHCNTSDILGTCSTSSVDF